MCGIGGVEEGTWKRVAGLVYIRFHWTYFQEIGNFGESRQMKSEKNAAS